MNAPITEDLTDAQRLSSLLKSLTLEDKVLLLTGRDLWTTHPLEKIGLRPMVFSDGPSGVRGQVWDERDPSMNFPSASTISSSWDPDIADRLGVASAVEARRKGIDVVLGPTINLHRSPLGGRHFEAFSEDPVLTAEMAAAYVAGVQRNGVGATPKHYVVNESETDRYNLDALVDERPLRELYLLAFEKAVVQARAWLVMSAYNSINGTTASEHSLLETPLNSEWNFDGVVISDWMAVRSLDSARAAQDLAMPGPDGPWGKALVSAVEAGDIEESVVDRKVLRILQLAARVGALDGFESAETEQLGREAMISFAREVSASGMVLVKNESLLPILPESVARIAVIGHNAEHARTQGGGSATVVPERVVSPIEGIRNAFPSAEVSYSVGAVVQRGVAELAPEQLKNPVTGAQGLRASFLAEDGDLLFAEDRLSSGLVWFGGAAPIGQSSMLELHTVYTPTKTGVVRLGAATVGHCRIVVDGTVIQDTHIEPSGSDFAEAFLAPASVSTPTTFTSGVPVDIRVELDTRDRVGPQALGLTITLGIETDDTDPESLIDEAVEAAKAADVAIVVVGTNSQVESEGFDRATLDLPGYQDRLVSAVASANPRTAVVVNAGSPVLLPWRHEVRATLIGYFGGQEFGNALADVITGNAEPGGRLPSTWPGSTEDVPVLNVTPDSHEAH